MLYYCIMCTSSPNMELVEGVDLTPTCTCIGINVSVVCVLSIPWNKGGCSLFHAYYCIILQCIRTIDWIRSEGHTGVVR